MGKFSESTAKSKPAKPREDFPLFAHASGRWAKKVRGRMEYFGPWAEPDKALENWLDWKEDLYAGRRPNKAGILSVKKLVNDFLNFKREILGRGEITSKTFQDYFATCGRLVAVFGRTRAVEGLTPEDFEQLRKKLGETRGPVALANEIGRVRVVFKYATDNGLVSKLIPFGQGFRKPSRKTLRKARAERGVRMFEADELLRMIDAAGLPLKAMILLAINAGLGQSDISNLPQTALDLDGGKFDYPRPKTGIERHGYLWPETVEALRLSLAARPRHRDAADAHLAFITKYGQRWVRMKPKGEDKWTGIDGISQQFRKLLKSLEINGHRGFYAIRHSFATIAGDAKDAVAVSYLMGHSDSSMGATYRERIAEERLRVVSDHVHNWLFPSAKSKV